CSGPRRAWSEGSLFDGGLHVRISEKTGRCDWARYACRGPLHALSASATVVSLVGLPGRVAPSASVENRRRTGVPPAIDGRTRTRLSHTASSRDSLLRAPRAGPQPPGTAAARFTIVTFWSARLPAPVAAPPRPPAP